MKAGNEKMRLAEKREGQTIIFLLVVLIILTLAAIWQFDIHKILHVKSKNQNAGDSAALVAARWQGLTLNLIGDLNIVKAVALSDNNLETVAAISNLQARISFTGPMIGLMASQQAAKNNGIYQNEAYKKRLQEHARDVRDVYTKIGADGKMLFPEPYPGCWDDYAQMLDYIADEGVAAGPDNAKLYTDYTGGHTLINPEFYEAVAGENWCWFFYSAPELLEDYRNFFPCWWPNLPPIGHSQYVNSEIFGVGIERQWTSLSNLFVNGKSTFETMQDSANERGLSSSMNIRIFKKTLWYCYDSAEWSSWSGRDGLPTTDNPTTHNAFPSAGTIKDKYNYTGADAAIRIQSSTDRLTPGEGGSKVTNVITWTAAAKSFGYLADDLRPDAYELVLPAFREVRLIPIDASSAPYGGAYDLEWREHIEDHLPVYIREGPGKLSSSCWYCRQLQTWEDAQFRQSGVDWLAENSDQCTISPSGPGRGGGSRRGH